MDLKSFFLSESLISEMAGMPKDNLYNGFMYKSIMQKYNYTWGGPGTGAWPKGVPDQQKLKDVAEWHGKAKAAGVSPGSPGLTLRRVVDGLEWPLKKGSGGTRGGKVSAPAKNTRSLAVQLGFATEDQMAQLWEAEGIDVNAEPQAAAADVGGEKVDPNTALESRQLGESIREFFLHKLQEGPRDPSFKPAPEVKPDDGIDAASVTDPAADPAMTQDVAPMEELSFFSQAARSAVSKYDLAADGFDSAALDAFASALDGMVEQAYSAVQDPSARQSFEADAMKMSADFGKDVSKLFDKVMKLKGHAV